MSSQPPRLPTKAYHPRHDGEAHKLTEEETLKVMERVLARAGSIPVVVGVSHAANNHVEHLSKIAMDKGAAGVMLAPAANLKTDDQVFNYYAAAAKLLGPNVPICLQDFPQATGVYMSTAVINRLIDEFPQWSCSSTKKCLACANSPTCARGLRRQRRISILVGNGGLFLPQEMLRGADGAMTGFAYLRCWSRSAISSSKVAQKKRKICSYLPATAASRIPVWPWPGIAQGNAEAAGRHQVCLRPQPGPVLNSTDMQELGHLISRQERQLAEIA
ncbi:hypothetical protein FQR65_LT07993 [Abscondita terminalis]|nr:hypothetical protein FQR65_LT07993 [Abscondita terminalis]